MRFYRPPKTAEVANPQAVAQSIRITTIIGPAEVMGRMKKVKGGHAVMVNEATVDPPGSMTFTEKGTITFGEGQGFGSLTFSSVGKGQLFNPVESSLNPGMVMWQVESGSGFFEGASGNITSNFLIDLNTDELIDHHFGLIYLP
jgi:hypothetical protein